MKLCLQAYFLDWTQDRPGGCGLHLAKAWLPPCQDYNSQVASEGCDGSSGQGSVGAHQEAGHRPAGREGEERPRQGGPLRKSHNITVIKAVQKFSNTGKLAPTVQHIYGTLPF